MSPAAAGAAAPGGAALALLWLAEIVMALAFLALLRAFALRRRDRRRHMLWGKSGALIALVGLSVVEVGKRGLGWRFPVRSQALLDWHIAVSAITLVLLIAVVTTGLVRLRAVHVRLAPLLLPAFATSIALSVAAFRLW